jgi:hypothetical protein
MGKKESLFFFEKKNQKTFAPSGVESGERIRHKSKIFCLFSSEKQAFLS